MARDGTALRKEQRHCKPIEHGDFEAPSVARAPREGQQGNIQPRVEGQKAHQRPDIHPEQRTSSQPEPRRIRQGHRGDEDSPLHRGADPSNRSDERNPLHRSADRSVIQSARSRVRREATVTFIRLIGAVSFLRSSRGYHTSRRARGLGQWQVGGEAGGSRSCWAPSFRLTGRDVRAACPAAASCVGVTSHQGSKIVRPKFPEQAPQSPVRQRSQCAATRRSSRRSVPRRG